MPKIKIFILICFVLKINSVSSLCCFYAYEGSLWPLTYCMVGGKAKLDYVKINRNSRPRPRVEDRKRLTSKNCSCSSEHVSHWTKNQAKIKESQYGGDESLLWMHVHAIRNPCHFAFVPRKYPLLNPNEFFHNFKLFKKVLLFEKVMNTLLYFVKSCIHKYEFFRI